MNKNRDKVGKKRIKEAAELNVRFVCVWCESTEKVTFCPGICSSELQTHSEQISSGPGFPRGVADEPS